MDESKVRGITVVAAVSTFWFCIMCVATLVAVSRIETLNEQLDSERQARSMQDTYVWNLQTRLAQQEKLTQQSETFAKFILGVCAPESEQVTQ